MKICLINNLYGAAAKGGAERIVQAEAEGLVRLGHEVTVISAKPSVRPEGRVCEPGVACSSPGISVREIGVMPRNLYFYGDGHRYAWPVRLLWHLVDTFSADGPKRVLDILERERPDIVHTHNLMGVGFRLPSLLRRTGWRHIHTVHDVQLVNPSGQMPALGSSLPVRFAEMLHGSLLRRLFGSPDTVIFPSEFMKVFYEKRGFFHESRRAIVCNPAPAPNFESRQGPESALRFLFVGQLEKHKGVEALLEAWALAGLKDATLEIVGRGSLEAAVSRAAERDASIVYRGRLQGKALDRVYLDAGFTVVPSLVLENSPTVIVESFAAGTPVIALATGGIPELVRDGETGLLASLTGGPSGVGSRVAVSLVSSLRSAATMRPDAWRIMSDNCRKLAEHRSIDRHVEYLLGEYRSAK